MQNETRAATVRTGLDRLFSNWLKKYRGTETPDASMEQLGIILVVELDRIALALEHLERAWRANHPRLPDHVKEFLNKKGYRVEP